MCRVEAKSFCFMPESTAILLCAVVLLTILMVVFVCCDAVHRELRLLSFTFLRYVMCALWVKGWL